MLDPAIQDYFQVLPASKYMKVSRDTIMKHMKDASSLILILDSTTVRARMDIGRLVNCFDGNHLHDTM